MTTESVDPGYEDIDRRPTGQAVAAMLDGQRRAVEAVAAQGDIIAVAAEAAAGRLGQAGRIAYAGAGTSGRIGVQDGVELTPTFGWPEDRLAFFLAGGPDAMTRAMEGAEDDEAAGRAAVREAGLGKADVLIGIAASGRTPYTLGALREAGQLGALTVGLANNPGSAVLEASNYAILLDTGAEAVAGSTRMGAGTAQKAALNALSTAIMLRLGFVYRGLMVNMRISNAKLRARAERMIAQLTGADEAAAAAALVEAGNNIRLAMLIASGLTPDQAAAALAGESFARLMDRLHPSG